MANLHLHDLIRILDPHKEAHARSWFIGHIKVVTTDQIIKISNESPTRMHSNRMRTAST